MADVTIEFCDGPRKGDTLSLKGQPDYPREIKVAAGSGAGTYFVTYAYAGFDHDKGKLPQYKLVKERG